MFVDKECLQNLQTFDHFDNIVDSMYNILQFIKKNEASNKFFF